MTRLYALLQLVLLCACSGTGSRDEAPDALQNQATADTNTISDTYGVESPDLRVSDEAASGPDFAELILEIHQEVSQPACVPCGTAKSPCPIGSMYSDLGPPAEEYGNLSAAIYYPACQEGEEKAVAPGASPVVVFGHGYQQSFGDYRYVWEALVPRGYIVALPDKLNEATTVDINEYAADLAHMADTLQLWGKDEDSPFFEKVAPAVAVMGHSTGSGAGIDAVATGLFKEIPPSTVVSLAPLGNIDAMPINGLSPIEAAADLHLPIIIMQGTWDCICPTEMNAQPIYEALPAETVKYFVELPDGDHCGFSDQEGPGLELCDTAEWGFCLMVFGMGDKRGDTMGSAKQNSLAISLALPWLNHHVKQKPAAWAHFLTALNKPEFVYD